MGLKKRVLSPQSLLDEEALLARTRELGIADDHVFRLVRLVIVNGLRDFSEQGFAEFSASATPATQRSLSQMPKKLVKLLRSDEFAIFTSKVLDSRESEDRSTRKLLIELQDGARIESVIMRYGQYELSSFPKERLAQMNAAAGANDDDDDAEASSSSTAASTTSSTGSIFRSNARATLCVSSQVGCAMGCTFCATGTMGLLANMTAGEILEQLLHARDFEPVRNVVFMGMGEPLDNYPAVCQSVRAMTDVRRFSIKATRVSVSTVGVVPRLRSMARDMPGVCLALSLHAPTQELRQQIVPTSAAWPLQKIIDALDQFLSTRKAQGLGGKSVNCMIEYVLIASVNDQEEHAHQLGLLLAKKPVMLNVIPYNKTDVPHDYHTPSQAVTERFCEVVRSHGVTTILRQTLGADAASACGQLVIEDQKGGKKAASAGTVRRKTEQEKMVDLEDLIKQSKLDVINSNTPTTTSSLSTSALYQRKNLNVKSGLNEEVDDRSAKLSESSGKQEPRHFSFLAILAVICAFFSIRFLIQTFILGK